MGGRWQPEDKTKKFYRDRWRLLKSTAVSYMRLDEITDLVRDGARTAYEVARQMRWTRKGLHIDELGTIHGMTAVLEVLAHLELLAAQDVVYREDHAQASLYEVA